MVTIILLSNKRIKLNLFTLDSFYKLCYLDSYIISLYLNYIMKVDQNYTKKMNHDVYIIFKKITSRFYESSFFESFL